jgi:hypothetical protein
VYEGHYFHRDALTRPLHESDHNFADYRQFGSWPETGFGEASNSVSKVLVAVNPLYRTLQLSDRIAFA